MGDAASDVLADGTFMLQQPCNTCLTNPDLTVDDALLNAKNLTWRVIPATGKTDPNDEEGWTLEPNGQLLTLDLWGIGNTELFNPRSDTWSFAGATAAGGDPVNPWPIVEIGPGTRCRAATRRGRGRQQHGRVSVGMHHERGDADGAVSVQVRQLDRGA